MTLYINMILLLLSVHLFLDWIVQQCIVANWNDILYGLLSKAHWCLSFISSALKRLKQSLYVYRRTAVNDLIEQFFQKISWCKIISHLFLSIELINFCHLIAIFFFLGEWVITYKFEILFFIFQNITMLKIACWLENWRAHFMSSVVGLKWNINAHISKLDILYQLSRPAKFKIFSQKRFKCHHSEWIMSKLWWNKKIDKLFITQSN